MHKKVWKISLIFLKLSYWATQGYVDYSIEGFESVMPGQTTNVYSIE